MRLISAKCVDFGSDFCPCIQAEMGTSPVCGLLRNNKFCDCGASHGICVKEELIRNGGKAKPGRTSIRCQVTEVIRLSDCLFFRVAVPISIEKEVKRPGGFVFVRRDDNPLYDMPLSVQYEENIVGSIGMSLIQQGVKSRRLSDLSIGDELWIRGPYFNGLFGQREIQQQKSGRCLLLGKGISMMPSIPVLQYLLANNNKVDVILDRTNFNNIVLDINLSLFDIKPEPITITNANGLTSIIKQRISDAMAEGVTLIHIGASEYVIRLITAYLRQEGYGHVRLTCSNNAKMCCGDAICGACTAIDFDRKTIHYCKEQIDIWKL